MGFLGSFVVVRTGKPISTYADTELFGVFADGGDAEWELGDGWWVAQIDGEEVIEDQLEVAPRLCEFTGAGVLTGFDLFEDAVAVTGFGPDPQAPPWWASLGRDCAEDALGHAMCVYSDLEAPDPAALEVEHCVQVTCAWAVANGLSPDEAGVRALYTAEQGDPYASDLFLGLLDAIGLRPPE